MDPYALVIAPVRSDPEFEAKMQIVRAVCHFAGLGCRLPKMNPGKFQVEAAIEAILGATVIVADLTYARPSCYYELGLVEGAGRRASLVAVTGTEIFQHSERGSVAYYDDLAAYELVLTHALDGPRQEASK